MSIIKLNVKARIGLLMVFACIYGCSVKPTPIDYGGTACHYCSMTIVDKQHASQVVTEKGKAYSFDAIECMLNHLKEEASIPISLYLVNDYMSPGELISASESTFLITKSIPSPMGAFLTGLKNKEDAQNLVKQHGGKLYTWEELREKFSQSNGVVLPE